MTTNLSCQSIASQYRELYAFPISHRSKTFACIPHIHHTTRHPAHLKLPQYLQQLADLARQLDPASAVTCTVPYLNLTQSLR